MELIKKNASLRERGSFMVSDRPGQVKGFPDDAAAEDWDGHNGANWVAWIALAVMRLFG